jgi:hypothetical protein
MNTIMNIILHFKNSPPAEKCPTNPAVFAGFEPELASFFAPPFADLEIVR